MAARGLKSWATAMLILAGACTAPHAPPPLPAKPAGPAPLAIAPPPPLSVAPPPKDACGAVALQYLIGKPRTEIPVPLQPGMRRVACTSCPVTQDFVPYRQTILYDAGTGLITSVKCG
jgi:hypothetical protein